MIIRDLPEELVSWLVGALSPVTTKHYIRAAQKLQSISKSLISQVIIPQVMFLGLFIFRGALSKGTCIRHGDLFYSAGLNRNHVLATASTGKDQERFWKKMQVNGPEG